jgi:hypothetical protein
LVKKKIEKPRREVTRRQLSRWQRQKKRQRILLGSGILIICAVLGLIGAGIYQQWYIPEYKPLHQIVITVNDTEFDMDYYIKMIKHYGQGMSIQQIYDLVDEVVVYIEQNELIRQETLNLGISISDKEVDNELKNRDIPLSKDYRDLVRAEMLITKLRDEHFEPAVPLFAEHRHILGMFLESEKQASETRDKLENDESFADLASQLSLDSFSKEKEGDLGWRPEGALTTLLNTSIPDEYAFSSELGVLSQPIYNEEITKGVGYWLIRVALRNEENEEAYIYAMLLSSEEQAQTVRTRLEAGEDFATLAKEFSQLGGVEDNEGSLGLVTPDTMTPASSEFIFNPEVELETLSQPLRDEDVWTEGGYWLVKVIDIDDDREIEDEDRDLLKAKALNEWLMALWDDPQNKVENYLDDEKKAWAITYIIESQN